MKQIGAEFFETCWLVLGGRGNALLAAAFPNGHKIARCVIRLRTYGIDHGIGDRSYFRLPFEQK